MRKITAGIGKRKRGSTSRGVTIMGGTHIVNQGTFIQNIGVKAPPSTPRKTPSPSPSSSSSIPLVPPTTCSRIGTSRQCVNDDPTIEARRQLLPHTSTSINGIHSSKAVSDQATCLSGTRQETISYLEDYLFGCVAGPTLRPGVLWLNGPAGCGKSTVLRTLCRRSRSTGSIASFFCFRFPSNPSSIVAALAYQMVALIPGTAPDVLEALERDPGLFVVRDVEWQVGALLRNPFVRARGEEKLGVVIDGISGQSGEEVLDALVGFVKATQGRARLLVSTRNPQELDYGIKARLEEMVRSGECDNFTVTEDDARVEVYYQDEFRKIQTAHAIPLAPAWPSPRQWNTLMRRTAGYGFASKVTALVGGGQNPKGDLEWVLQVTEMSLWDTGELATGGGSQNMHQASNPPPFPRTTPGYLATLAGLPPIRLFPQTTEASARFINRDNLMAMTLPLDTIDDRTSPAPATDNSAESTSSPPPSAAQPATAPDAQQTQQPKRKPSRRANTAERRATHNAVERQRRETLNGRFLDLAALLPNLSQIRRPSKSSIVNSSIAHIHASRRHRILAARELRQLKHEAESLRREINEWRDRAGMPRSDEPIRSEAFAMILSGELELIPVPASQGQDEDDEDGEDVGVHATYVQDDMTLDTDDGLLPPHQAHHHQAPTALPPVHPQMYQAPPSHQQHTLDLDDPRFVALLKHQQSQGPFAHSVPPRPVHFEYQQYVPPHAQWEAAAAAAAQRSLFTPPTSSHGMPNPPSPNSSSVTTSAQNGRQMMTSKNSPGSPATAPSPHDSIHSGSGAGGSPSPPLPHHHIYQQQQQQHHQHHPLMHPQQHQQPHHGQQHMTLSINTAAALAAASRPSPPASSVGGTPPNTAISPVASTHNGSPRERAYELHHAAAQAGSYGSVPRFAGSGYAPSAAGGGMMGMHAAHAHAGMVGMSSNGMMMMM